MPWQEQGLTAPDPLDTRLYFADEATPLTGVNRPSLSDCKLLPGKILTGRHDLEPGSIGRDQIASSAVSSLSSHTPASDDPAQTAATDHNNKVAILDRDGQLKSITRMVEHTGNHVAS